MSSDTSAPSWRFLFRPKWLGWHALMVLTVLGMLALGDWQFRRAESGNSLSWAYTFEWPIFAGFLIVFWAKTIKDEFRPPAQAEGLDGVALPAGRGGAAGLASSAGGADVAEDEDDEELAAYNAYLARLTAEASRHGKWHGFR
ncbi:MAG: hypothetical protein ACRDND_18320 [Streptosporangiaceae bacterium]